MHLILWFVGVLLVFYVLCALGFFLLALGCKLLKMAWHALCWVPPVVPARVPRPSLPRSVRAALAKQWVDVDPQGYWAEQARRGAAAWVERNQRVRA